MFAAKVTQDELPLFWAENLSLFICASLLSAAILFMELWRQSCINQKRPVIWCLYLSPSSWLWQTMWQRAACRVCSSWWRGGVASGVRLLAHISVDQEGETGQETGLEHQPPSCSPETNFLPVDLQCLEFLTTSSSWRWSVQTQESVCLWCVSGEGVCTKPHQCLLDSCPNTYSHVLADTILSHSCLRN